MATWHQMQAKFKITFCYRPLALKDGKPYECVKVSNSLEFSPGEWYDKKEVQYLCEKTTWDVTIVN